MSDKSTWSAQVQSITDLGYPDNEAKRGQSEVLDQLLDEIEETLRR